MPPELAGIIRIDDPQWQLGNGPLATNYTAGAGNDNCYLLIVTSFECVIPLAGIF